MSTSEQFQTTGGAGGVEPHTCADDTDTRVFVQGTRIPVGNVDIHLRKDGPASSSRYAEVTFAASFQGERYASLFSAATPDEQDGFDVLEIDVHDEVSGDYALAFKGCVTGVGPTADGPREIWEARAQSPAHFLSQVPASARFTEADAEAAVAYVAETLDKKLPFPVRDTVSGIDIVPTGIIEREIVGNAFTEPVGVLTNAVLGRINTPRTFTANRDTLADVVNWLENKTGTYLSFVPLDDGVGLVATEKPASRSHTAHYLPDGDTMVVENNALSELRPFNTLVVKSKAARSLAEIGGYELNVPRDTFFAAKARHTALYERAGGVELHTDPHVSSDSESKRETVAEARRRLKDRVDSTTAGDMILRLKGHVAPFDTITARPTCNGVDDATTQPLEYEIHRVHHAIRTGDSDEKTHTSVVVGPHTDPQDDIEIVDTWEEDA